ncbi:MAG: aminotransferase class V-fold PLP-dependent enzyme [Winogradskyella sp.]|nr:aminotransferase class V-fold PLP-dependent enzyme [Winogradskyella sp.]
MALRSQKHVFNLPDDVTYFNTASLSPSFKSVEAAGIEAVINKSHPYKIPSSDFFDPVTELRKRFAKLIDCNDYQRVVTSPSVSYGMANVANNIKLQKGDEILVIEEQFPSNVYTWRKLAQRYDAKLVTIKKPAVKTNCGQQWNEAILKAITKNTAVVALGHIHWSNGIIFNLKAIRQKTLKHNALLIVDGSQSIGVMPFSIENLQPDALLCAGYKWLFGPYGCAYAYYGPKFDNGIPIEENWSNRLNSENLVGLTNYQDLYKPLANRYAVGENGSFIYVKMQLAALNEVLKYNPKDIQDYCRSISEKAIHKFREMGCSVFDAGERANHLFGIELPENIDVDLLQKKLKEQKIYVSFRGKYMRISCYLFNTENDFDKLVKAMEATFK